MPNPYGGFLPEKKTHGQEQKPKPDAVKLSNTYGIEVIARSALEDFQTSLKLGQLVKLGFVFKYGTSWGDWPPEELKELLAIVETTGFINSEHYHDYLIKREYYERFGSTDVITMPQPVITIEQEESSKKLHDVMAKFYGNKQKPG